MTTSLIMSLTDLIWIGVVDLMCRLPICSYIDLVMILDTPGLSSSNPTCNQNLCAF